MTTVLDDQGYTTTLLRLRPPVGWFVKESHTLLAPDGRSNVIASAEPLSPDVTLETYVQTESELLAREFQGYEELFLEPFRMDYFKAVGTCEARIRGFRWYPERGDSVQQLQIYAVLPGIGITGTATATVADYAERRALLERALRSIVLDPSVVGRSQTEPAAGSDPNQLG